MLGTPIGHGKTTTDFLEKTITEFLRRVELYRNNPMSQLMRIHAANIPILSYVQRIIMLPVRVVRDKSNKLLRFITPLTFCVQVTPSRYYFASATKWTS